MDDKLLEKMFETERIFEGSRASLKICGDYFIHCDGKLKEASEEDKFYFKDIKSIKAIRNKKTLKITSIAYIDNKKGDFYIYKFKDMDEILKVLDERARNFGIKRLEGWEEPNITLKGVFFIILITVGLIAGYQYLKKLDKSTLSLIVGLFLFIGGLSIIVIRFVKKEQFSRFLVFPNESAAFALFKVIMATIIGAVMILANVFHWVF